MATNKYPTLIINESFTGTLVTTNNLGITRAILANVTIEQNTCDSLYDAYNYVANNLHIGYYDGSNYVQYDIASIELFSFEQTDNNTYNGTILVSFSKSNDEIIDKELVLYMDQHPYITFKYTAYNPVTINKYDVGFLISNSGTLSIPKTKIFTITKNSYVDSINIQTDIVTTCTSTDITSFQPLISYDEVEPNIIDVYIDSLQINPVIPTRQIITITTTVHPSVSKHNPKDGLENPVEAITTKSETATVTISSESEIEHNPTVAEYLLVYTTGTYLLYTEDENFNIEKYSIDQTSFNYILSTGTNEYNNTIINIDITSLPPESTNINLNVQSIDKTYYTEISNIYTIPIYKDQIAIIDPKYILTTNNIERVNITKIPQYSGIIIDDPNEIITNTGITNTGTYVPIDLNINPAKFGPSIVSFYCIDDDSFKVFLPVVHATSITPGSENTIITHTNNQIVCDVYNNSVTKTVCIIIDGQKTYQSISNVNNITESIRRSIHNISNLSQDAVIYVFEIISGNAYTDRCYIYSINDIQMFTDKMVLPITSSSTLYVDSNHSFRDRKYIYVEAKNIILSSNRSTKLLTKEQSLPGNKEIGQIRLLVFGNNEINNCIYYILYPDTSSKYTIKYQILPINIYSSSIAIPHTHIINNKLDSYSVSGIKLLNFDYNIYNVKLQIEYPGGKSIYITNLYLLLDEVIR